MESGSEESMDEVDPAVPGAVGTGPPNESVNAIPDPVPISNREVMQYMFGCDSLLSEFYRNVQRTGYRNPTLSSDDSSASGDETEFDVLTGRYRHFPRRTFSQCDSPDSSFDIKVLDFYDSEDRTSALLIGGLSGINLQGESSLPGTQPLPGTSRKGERSIEEETLQEKSEESHANPKHVCDSEGTSGISSPKTEETDSPEEKTVQTSLLTPPQSSRDSISPSKRKVQDIETDLCSEQTPVKKGRLSSELDPVKKAETTSTPKTEDRHSEGQEKEHHCPLKPPTQSSRDSISPTKRKAAELDAECDAGSSEELLKKSEVFSPKRPKIKPPTPVEDVVKNLNELEE